MLVFIFETYYLYFLFQLIDIHFALLLVVASLYNCHC